MSDTTIPTRRGEPAVAALSLLERVTSALRLRCAEPLLLVLLLSLAVALAYWPGCKALNGFWLDTADRAYTHGYLVLLISAWLVVRERRRLLAVPLHTEWSALAALVLLSAAWLWFWRAALQDLHLLLLPLLLLVAVACALGLRAARLLAFPIAFLYFAMPVWSDLVGLLQDLSIRANSALISLTGLPAYVSGDLVHVPAGTLEIADGCSGLHFLVVGLALAALYGHLADDPPRWRLLWMVLMGALAIVGNWVRIFIIVVAAYASDMRTYLVTVDHYWFGWGIFVLCFVAFLWLAGRLHRPHPAAARDAQGSDAQGSEAQGSEAQSGRPGSRMHGADAQAATASRLSLPGVTVTVLCLATLPALGYASDWLQPSLAPLQINWPLAPSGWSGPELVVSDWKPQFQGASAAAQRQYRNERGQTVEVFEVVYRTQRQDAKLLGYGNSLLGSEGLLRQLDEHVERSGASVWQQTTVADEAGQRSLLWARYRVGKRWFVKPRAAQLWYGVTALAGPVVSSLTALRTACEPDCTAAQERLASLSAQLQPALRHRSEGSLGKEGGSAP